MKKTNLITSQEIAMFTQKHWSLDYFAQMAEHIQRMYEQGFIDHYLHNLDSGFDLIVECRRAARQLKDDFDIFRKYAGWIGEDTLKLYDPNEIINI